MMTKPCFARRVFVDAYQLEISHEGEITLWFDHDLEALRAELSGDWTLEEISAQFRCEAREVGRALFAGLPVAWIAFDDGGPGVRGDFYRAEVGPLEFEELLSVVLDRIR